MNQYLFPFSGHPIEINTEKKIKDKDLKLLVNFVELTKKDLSHSVYSSSAYRFNDANENTLILLSEEFLKYFQICIEISEITKKSFFPFKGIDKSEDLKSLVTLDKNSKGLTKLKNFYFDSNLFLSAYILDELENLLKALKVKKYQIEKNNFFCSKNLGFSKFTFEIDDSKKLEEKICDETCSIFYVEEEKEAKKLPEKFGNTNKQIVPSHLIIYGKTFAENFIFKNLIASKNFESEFMEFAFVNKVTFKIVDDEGKVHLFTPIT